MSEKSPAKVVCTDLTTQTVSEIPLPKTNVETKKLSNGFTEYSETYEAILKVDNTGAQKIQLVDTVPVAAPRGSQTGEDHNVYWAAYITITWSQGKDPTGKDIVALTKVSGNWNQLRGTSTIRRRYVNYGQTSLFDNNRAGSYQPSSNNFSIGTGFSSGHIIFGRTWIGANSTIYYSPQNISEVSLSVRSDKYF